MDRVVDFEQMLENQLFVSMRLTYDSGVWTTLYVTKNVDKYGFSQEEFLSGKVRWNDILHPDDRVAAQNLASEYMEKNLDDFRLQYRIQSRLGENIFITEYAKANRAPDGTIISIDSFLLNTTGTQMDRVMVQQHLRRQSILNDILINLQQTDLDVALQIILDRAGQYLDCSRVLLFEDSPDRKTCRVVYEWLNKGIGSIKDREYALTYATEMPEIYAALHRTGMMLINAGEIPDNCKEVFRNAGLVSSAIFAVYVHGKQYGFVCFDDCVIPRVWDKDTAGFLKNISNIISTVLLRMETESQIRQHENEIRRMAFADPLTGLPNRYRCDADLTNAINRAKILGKPGYLLFTDLDDFKIVNDSYGHDFGDGVLVSFARYIQDLFGDKNEVFRFGGDEFVIIVKPEQGGELRNFLDAMLKRARQPWFALGREFFCSLSIGVVEFPAHGADPTSIIKKADIAMYQAKQAGKNTYAFYADGLDSDAIRRSEMERVLRTAMQNDFQGFVVHYQTYSDTVSGKILGAEALIRLFAPDGSLILPDRFLPLAEYLGFIDALGEFVLAKAAEECRVINESGHPDFSITINLSAKQFRQNTITSQLIHTLEAAKVNLDNIIVSINENVAVKELERMLTLCNELRRQGIRVALDDFGSGSSSFINMRQLPVDIIKVSSGYVDDIDDQFTGYFLNLVTELGHFTGKTICMNGVETEKQLRFCQEHTIDMVQGFLLHKPAPAEILLELLSSR